MALFTFGSFTNPGRQEPSYAFVNTVLRLKKAFGASFDSYYLTARKNDWYFSGVQGCNSLEASFAEIERAMASYDATMFLGNSMGGYAAMLFGAPLKADAILAFSPQTRFDSAFCEQIGESRWRDAYIEMRAQHDVEAMALHSRWPNTYDGSVDIHFGAGCGQDKEYAAQLSGMSGVSLVPHEGLDHDLVHDLRATKTLDEIIWNGLQNLDTKSAK
ncbi:YqiA/YcfP family alpha/beta fold hydrolase [Altererythrobacter sp. B11]|uniref:YqiA/YcfP family alpha/beta fold hydrolase n=1 Tax=Altererythrobacter sp. B11 TaxID=2060312 RepID=UPI0015596C03|nr:YqiA/YcfP family alpha/beta fold hydrolase [Altererythrobacter sp. B11]